MHRTDICCDPIYPLTFSSVCSGDRRQAQPNWSNPVKISSPSCCRAHRSIRGERHGPGMAADDSHHDQEVPPQPQRLEGPDLPDPSPCSVHGDCHGYELHQERPAALPWAGAQPGALQLFPQLLFLQVSPHGGYTTREHWRGRTEKQIRLTRVIFTPRIFRGVQ